MNAKRAPMAAAGLFAALVAAAASAPAIASAPAGAAACSGCHAAAAGVASAVPRLTGMDVADIVKAMQAFREGTRPATVMDRIARGFTASEVEAIAEWYARQR